MPYPYPAHYGEVDWVKFHTPLLLGRSINAVKMREGRDAEYVVMTDYIASYSVGGKAGLIKVPAGMLTDLASVPKRLQSFVGKTGPHLEACILHDYLYVAWQDIPGYRALKRDKEFADNILMAGMIESKVPWLRRNVIHKAVATFGWPTYKERDPRRYLGAGELSEIMSATPYPKA